MEGILQTRLAQYIAIHQVGVVPWVLELGRGEMIGSQTTASCGGTGEHECSLTLVACLQHQKAIQQDLGLLPVAMRNKTKSKTPEKDLGLSMATWLTG